MPHHFISYSNADTAEFALNLYNKLEAGPPPIPCWLDKHHLQAGVDWDIQIRNAIRDCETVLFLMSPDSVTDELVCRDEWSLALKYKKPIIPLRIVKGVEAPFRLQNRQYIDFSGRFETGLAKLREHLQWRQSPEGELFTLNERLKDAERDLQRAQEELDQARIKKEMSDLKQDIIRQKKVVENPSDAVRLADHSIKARMELERQPKRKSKVRTKFINPPPVTAPDYFQDRQDETRRMADFLRSDALRLLTIVGRAGNGKTALACRLLKALEGGQLPDNLGSLPVDGIVYLSAVGARPLTVPNLYADLCELLPDAVAQELDTLYRDPKASTEEKLWALLQHFPSKRVVVLLDNFETVIDSDTSKIADQELDEALRALLKLPQHAVKVILTTRAKPRDLMMFQPGRQRVVELDEGLPSPFAGRILQAMDRDGTLGLRDLPEDHPLLREARDRTCGYPRALESLYGILSVDRSTSLSDMLEDIHQREQAEGAARLLPENVVEAMVGEAFNRLDPTARMVIQALAIYGRPVPSVAVDHLLLPHRPGIDSTPVLARLLNMHFVRKEGGAYYLHPVDRAYALSLIPRREVASSLPPLSQFMKEKSPRDLYEELVSNPRVERTKGERVVSIRVEKKRRQEMPEVFTQISLLRRAADYFKSARKPRAKWKTIQDLAPQLAEFDLRYAAEDYDTAAYVLTEIDFNCLQLWGYYRLVAQMYERLQDKISVKELKRASAGNLGSAYYAMGRVREAITCYESALISARETKYLQNEEALLGNLGSVYRSLGQVRRAIEYYEQALAIARATDDQKEEGTALGGLGNVYFDLGQMTRAIGYFEQALAIAREIDDRQSQGLWLGNLGNASAELGQSEQSIEYYRQSLVIAREIGDRSQEAWDLGSIGFDHIHRNEWVAAVTICHEAIRIADEIGFVQTQSCGRSALAEAHLYSGDLSAARTVIEIARQYDYPPNNHNILALLGVIALRQGDQAAASAAFAGAVSTSDALLVHSNQNFGALDTKGLALCGLALIPTASSDQEEYRAKAEAAFRAARAITAAPGIVARVLRAFDALAVADTQGVLAGVRPAVAGE